MKQQNNIISNFQEIVKCWCHNWKQDQRNLTIDQIYQIARSEQFKQFKKDKNEKQ